MARSQLEVIFQPKLDRSQGELCGYNLRLYSTAEKLLDTIFHRRYGAPKAAAFSLCHSKHEKKPAVSEGARWL